MKPLVSEFWAALIGGAIAATASWLTTHAQWKRERAERRRERVDEAVVEARAAAHDWAVWSSQDEHSKERLLRLVRAMAHLQARSARDFPGLAEITARVDNEVMRALEEADRLGEDADHVVAHWRAAAHVLMVCCDTWLSDDSRFKGSSPGHEEALAELDALDAEWGSAADEVSQ